MVTYNPLLEEREYKNGLFAKMPVAEEGQAIILSIRGVNGPVAVVTTSGGPGIRSIKDGR